MPRYSSMRTLQDLVMNSFLYNFSKPMKAQYSVLFLLLTGLLLSACNSSKPVNQESVPVSHEAWTELLNQYVSESGKVDYAGFQADSVSLNTYLELLSKNSPNDKNWNRNEQLAYWINAYNAFTIQLVIRHYPLVSIKDISKGIDIPFISSVWDMKFISIGGKKIDLNNIEHSYIRNEFKEPRIHFALVCASYSCPRLLKEAYTADQLESQLDLQTRNFLQDTRKNQLSADAPKLSKILSWYRMDFNKDGNTVKSFINSYSDVKLSEKAELTYLEYDWTLNERE